MGLQDRYVPQHAIAVIAHFLRLEKLTGFRWSPSSKSTYNNKIKIIEKKKRQSFLKNSEKNKNKSKKLT